MRTDIFHANPTIPPNGITYPTLFNELDAISGGASELTPEFAAKLGQAAASISSRIAVGYTDSGICKLLANAFIAGAGMGGASVTETDASFFAVASFISRNYLFNLTVFFENDNGRLRIRMADKYGLAIDRDIQKKIEIAAGISASRSDETHNITMPKSITGTKETYKLFTSNSKISRAFPVCVPERNAASKTLKEILSDSGCKICDQTCGAITFLASDDGITLSLSSENDNWYDNGHVTALLAYVYFLSGKSELAVPASAPSVVEQIASDFGGRILRIGRDNGAKEIFLTQQIITDAASSAVFLCSYLSETERKLSSLIEELPSFTLVSREINVSKNRNEILASLAKPGDGLHKEDTGELRICTDGGWVNISPVRGRRSLRVTGEAMNEEIASELCNLFVEKTQNIDKNT